MSVKIEHTVSQEPIFSGKVFDISRDTVKIDDNLFVRELVSHNGGVSVLAIDNDDNIYMVRQYRYGAKDVLLELPAGKLEKGENPRECAIRELKEETGMSAAEFVFLAELIPTPAYCSEKISIFLARGLTAGEQKLDPDEYLSVEKIPFKEALQMCIDGRVTDSKTLIGILKYAVISTN